MVRLKPVTDGWYHCVLCLCSLNASGLCPQLSAVLNEPNNSNICSNRCNLHGILCIFICANSCPSVPNICWCSLRTCWLRLVPQSRSCCQTVSVLNFRAGLGSTSVRQPRAGGDNPHRGQKTEAAHERAPIRLLWNIYGASCSQQKLKKGQTACPTLAAAACSQHVLRYICAAPPSRPSNRCLSDSPSCVLEQILRGWGVVVAVKSFTNICNAIMLNYGWSTFA